MPGSAELSESQLLENLRQGDESALRTIFDHHYPLLLSDLYRYIPDEDTCKDLAQDVFVELWSRREHLTIHTSLRAYLRRAAINRALNFIKVNRRTLLDSSDDRRHLADTSLSDIGQKNEQENLEKALQQAIQQLPERCRIVFSLSRFEHLSHREISEKLGISVKTIENQITKAMRILRETMLKYPNLSWAVIWVLNCLHSG